MIIYSLPNANASVVTVTSTATTLYDLINTAGSTTVEFPTNLDGVDLIVEASSVRVLFDGNVPTASKGVLLGQGVYKFRGVNLNKCRLIRVGGSNISVGVQIGFASPNELATSDVASAGGGGGSPGGSPGQIQYNDSGSFGGISGWETDGVTQAITNGVFLEAYESDATTKDSIMRMSLFDVVEVGSLTNGNGASLISTDSSFTTSVTVDGNNIALVQGTASDEYIEYKMSAFPFEESLKLETASSLSSGLESQIRILSQASTDGDVIYTTGISALSDAQNEVQYYMQRITQTIAQDGVESTDVLWRVVNEGASVDVLGVNKGRLYTPIMPNFRAEAVTGGVGFFQVETSLAGGNYRAFIGAGTTVPADATGNVFASSAIFTDTDATVDTVARTYINQGTDSNARFRAVATYTAAGQLMTPNTNSQVLVYGGTASIAGLTFVGAGTNSGWYSSAAGVVNLTLGGTERFRFQLASMRWVQGTASTPQHTTAADNDTGMWLETGVTGFSVDSVEIGRFVSTGLQMADAKNFVFNTTTGTKIGTGTTQKIGFWNATPIVQPTTGIAAATFTANTSGIANDTATFDGYTIGQVVKALRNAGLLA